MPEQDDFPDSWVCEGEQKKVTVELRVPNAAEAVGVDLLDDAFDDYTWIEIPTQSVELWVEKGESAQIQRTAKVVHPTEWGENDDTVRHNSPRQLITQYSSTDANPILFARISFQRESGEWVYTHFGWVGGVGGTDSTEMGATSKFWVYDVAEMLSGVPISTTLSEPGMGSALGEITRLTNSNTPIPVSQAALVGPNVEERTAVEASSSDENRAAASPTTYYSSSFDEDTEPKADDNRFQPVAYVVENDENIGSQTFISNHDTLLDVYDWFESRTDANLHFEPTGDGRSVVLVADVQPSRRTFTQSAVLTEAMQSGSPEAFPEYHESVEVLKNNALYEMKPKNTVYLNGSTGKSGLARAAFETSVDVAEEVVELGASQLAGGLVELEEPSETYPHVKVQVPPLVEAAGGVELAPELVESDAATLEQAERVARRKLRQLLEEPSEGEIVLSGVPSIRPFDRVVAYEVCNDDVIYDAEPIQYEVESVKHEKTATTFYTVRLRVSIWANETHIETVEKTMTRG